MTNRLFISLTPLAATLLLASCGFARTCDNSHPYKSNVARAPLKAPAGVTVPAPDAAYQIPAAGTAAAPAATTSADPCLVTPPSVLTKQDMARPIQAPPAGTKAPPKPAPAAASKSPPVAGG